MYLGVPLNREENSASDKDLLMMSVMQTEEHINYKWTVTKTGKTEEKE